MYTLKVFCLRRRWKAGLLLGLLRRHSLCLHSGVRMTFLTLKNTLKVDSELSFNYTGSLLTGLPTLSGSKKQCFYPTGTSRWHIERIVCTICPWMAIFHLPFHGITGVIELLCFPFICHWWCTRCAIVGKSRPTGDVMLLLPVGFKICKWNCLTNVMFFIKSSKKWELRVKGKHRLGLLLLKCIILPWA